MKNIGVTGTRDGMSLKQKETYSQTVTWKPLYSSKTTVIL